MYRALVRRTVRRAFDDLGRNRFARHVGRFAEGAVMRVHVDGGTRVFTGAAQLREAFEGLGGSTMEGPFELLDIWVKGWPWDTRVAVAWRRYKRAEEGREIVHGMNRLRLGRRGVIEEDVFIGSGTGDL